MSIAVCVLILISASSPEEFLQELCDNSSGPQGAEFWADHASESVQYGLSDADSLLQLLSNKQRLSVIPGTRTAFETRETTFVIEYGRSSWTWVDGEGGIHRSEGLTVVECTDGDYGWREIPLLNSGSVRVGETEKLVSGFILTMLVLLFATILISWAKRRYL